MAVLRENYETSDSGWIRHHISLNNLFKVQNMKIDLDSTEIGYYGKDSGIKKISFLAYGTKIRLISKVFNQLSNSVTVKIDGQFHSNVNQYNSVILDSALIAEITNLEEKMHFVELSVANNEQMCFNAFETEFNTLLKLKELFLFNLPKTTGKLLNDFSEENSVGDYLHFASNNENFDLTIPSEENCYITEEVKKTVPGLNYTNSNFFIKSSKNNFISSAPTCKFTFTDLKNFDILNGYPLAIKEIYLNGGNSAIINPYKEGNFKKDLTVSVRFSRDSIETGTSHFYIMSSLQNGGFAIRYTSKILYFIIRYSTTLEESISIPYNFLNNVDYEVTCVFNNGIELSIYINGELVKNGRLSTIRTIYTSYNNGIAIGSDVSAGFAPDADNAYFKSMRFNKILISIRPFNDKEVLDYYEKGLPNVMKQDLFYLDYINYNTNKLSNMSYHKNATISINNNYLVKKFKNYANLYIMSGGYNFSNNLTISYKNDYDSLMVNFSKNLLNKTDSKNLFNLELPTITSNFASSKLTSETSLIQRYGLTEHTEENIDYTKNLSFRPMLRYEGSVI